jgi:UDP-glucose 4-epimerase
MPSLTGSRIAVVGGAGLVGSHIVDQLVHTDVEEILVFDNFVRGTRRNVEQACSSSKVRLVVGDVRDRAALRQVLDGVDYVFLLTALWLGECVAQPREALDVNVVGLYNVIELCQELGIKKIVYSSSASVYGDAVQVPMTEDHPFNNRTFYGATKVAGEQFLRAFYDMYGLPYVGLRYMNIYGPRMDYKGTYVSVIMKVLDRIQQGLPPIIFGDGSQSYDFIHVSDVARANILALQSEATDECFNIGMGVRTTINELVALLLEITGSTLQPEYRPQERMFVTHRVGSTDKAEKMLGFRATIPLRAGLRSVVTWRQMDQQCDATLQV